MNTLPQTRSILLFVNLDFYGELTKKLLFYLFNTIIVFIQILYMIHLSIN